MQAQPLLVSEKKYNDFKNNNIQVYYTMNSPVKKISSSTVFSSGMFKEKIESMSERKSESKGKSRELRNLQVKEMSNENENPYLYSQYTPTIHKYKSSVLFSNEKLNLQSLINNSGKIEEKQYNLTDRSNKVKLKNLTLTKFHKYIKVKEGRKYSIFNDITIKSLKNATPRLINKSNIPVLTTDEPKTDRNGYHAHQVLSPDNNTVRYNKFSFNSLPIHKLNSNTKYSPKVGRTSRISIDIKEDDDVSEFYIETETNKSNF